MIAPLPETRDHITRFRFDVERSKNKAGTYLLPEHVRLSGCAPTARLLLGQWWRLTVHLKRPWGFMNPGGFDYEGWLYSQGIRATGYERDTLSAKSLPSKSIAYPIGHLRQAVTKAIARRLNQSPNIVIITALAMREGGDTDARPMELMLATGTNYFIAISGLTLL